jgi:hypothetical protein
MVRKLGDGHVVIHWPTSRTSVTSSATDPCQDYDASRAASPLVANAKGYVPLSTPQSAIFPAGLVRVAGRSVGVIEIGLIGAGATPQLCVQALAALKVNPHGPCDEACGDRIEQWTNDRYTEDFSAQIASLKRAGAKALLVDIAGNGGGNEWADAAARMLTPKRLVSERMKFVRGQQWSKNLAALETKLRKDAAGTTGSDREMLLRFANQAHDKALIAATPCSSEALLTGQTPTCVWLGDGFSVTGPLAIADANHLREKPWARDVFIPMKYPFEEGLWQGPLMVLVDGATASSAEEFTSVLQDNRAAFVMGLPTAGAGCGFTDGNEPLKLHYSGATLTIPDCVYIRSDGTNEVRGVVPDLLVGFRRSDSSRLRAADVLTRLPEALLEASILERNP